MAGAASWEAVVGDTALVVVLDGIQDPGNAGTIVRSAEAFGASGVVFAQGSVHWANGKFLRATAGSIFRMPALEAVTRGEIVRKLAAARVRLYVLDAKAMAPLSGADLVTPCALIVGSEANGASAELSAAAQAIAIPAQRVESLNAAVACSIAVFEAARQRGQQ